MAAEKTAAVNAPARAFGWVASEAYVPSGESRPVAVCEDGPTPTVAGSVEVPRWCARFVSHTPAEAAFADLLQRIGAALGVEMVHHLEDVVGRLRNEVYDFGHAVGAGHVPTEVPADPTEAADRNRVAELTDLRRHLRVTRSHFAAYAEVMPEEYRGRWTRLTDRLEKRAAALAERPSVAVVS